MATLADIRPDERRTLLVAFSTLFGILAAHTVLETARDALFLARLPASQLPWVYIAMAVAAVLISQVPAQGLRAKLGRHGLSASLLLMALVTFGGAYAVLGYVAQQAVTTYHWVTPGEMLDGLGMAETTPGPLIMVLQFVGFMAAHRAPGLFSPLPAGALGACSPSG